MKIVIIGHGFVGKAVEYGFSTKGVETIIIDPIYETSPTLGRLKSISDIEHVRDINLIFVCVPTPMNDDGTINSSSVLDTIQEINKHGLGGIIVVKSTITPDIAEKITRHNIRTVYNPEFLREKTANEDFVNPSMHVFGGIDVSTAIVQAAYENHSLCKPCPAFCMSPKEAAFVKYGINTFLASKVAWFNQFYDVVNDNNAAFNKVINAMTEDPRIGKSHTNVPGFDGKRGFGGACFPKDVAAFLNFDTSFTFLQEVITINNTMRSVYEKDDREKEQNVKFLKLET